MDKTAERPKGVGGSGSVSTSEGTVPSDLRRMYRTARDEGLPASFSFTLDGITYRYVKLQWDIDGKLQGLRYGTNPHQSAALYIPQGVAVRLSSLEWLKWGKGGPSITNMQDGIRGLHLVDHFVEPAVAVMKHLNPSGVAIRRGDSLTDVYNRARNADNRAAFGSVVVFNSPVDGSTADAITKTFVEVIFAPDYAASALATLDAKGNLRVAKIPNDSSDAHTDAPNIFSLDGALALEDVYATKVNSLEVVKQLQVMTTRKPTEEEYEDLLHGWLVVSEIRSNGVVFWKDGTSLAVGTGQQDRIGAIENSIDKAKRNGHDLRGSVMASDGFIPNVDNIVAIAAEGVRAVIQPGGSNADLDIIAACNQHGLTMLFTGERAFSHH